MQENQRKILAVTAGKVHGESCGCLYCEAGRQAYRNKYESLEADWINQETQTDDGREAGTPQTKCPKCQKEGQRCDCFNDCVDAIAMSFAICKRQANRNERG